MGDEDFLAERFEQHRARLRAVAYRMLGSGAEADDAVQEAWLRLSRTGADEVRNLGGWLTTVVARVALTMLRSRATRREQPWDTDGPEPAGTPVGTRPGDHTEPADPEREAVLADSVGVAMLVVLDTLAPAERLAFVLHDMFAVPFEEIAPIVDRSPAATRQLASRARRRVRGGDPTAAPSDAPAAAAPDLRARQRQVVEAFLTASRQGDFQALLAVLDPDVVLRADPLAVRTARQAGAAAPTLAAETRGAAAVADAFAGKARGAQPALIDGMPGAAWVPDGRVRATFAFTLRDGRIVGIDLHVDPDHMAGQEVELLT